MKSTTTATIRTAVPAAWATAIVWIVAQLGLELDPDDWQAVALVMPIIIGIVYRTLRMVEARWPQLGWILFGSASTPSYNSEGPIL